MIEVCHFPLRSHIGCVEAPHSTIRLHFSIFQAHHQGCSKSYHTTPCRELTQQTFHATKLFHHEDVEKGPKSERGPFSVSRRQVVLRWIHLTFLCVVFVLDSTQKKLKKLLVASCFLCFSGTWHDMIGVQATSDNPVFMKNIDVSRKYHLFVSRNFSKHWEWQNPSMKPNLLGFFPIFKLLVVWNTFPPPRKNLKCLSSIFRLEIYHSKLSTPPPPQTNLTAGQQCQTSCLKDDVHVENQPQTMRQTERMLIERSLEVQTSDNMERWKAEQGSRVRRK